MDVRCERCKTEYEFDDARITEAGVTVKCTTCGHIFKVKKKALVVTVPVKPGEAGAQDAPPATSAAPPPPVADKPREWKVRQANGNVFTFKELTTLQKWIVERKVSRDDEISLTGDNWKRLGNIAELASFFQVVEEAQKAQQLQALQSQALLTPVGGTPVAGPAAASAPPPATPVAPAAHAAPTRPPEPPPPAPVQEPVSRPMVSPPPQTAAAEPRFVAHARTTDFREDVATTGTRKSGGGAAWLVVLLMLAVIGAAGYFGWQQGYLDPLLSRIQPSLMSRQSQPAPSPEAAVPAAPTPNAANLAEAAADAGTGVVDAGIAEKAAEPQDAGSAAEVVPAAANAKGAVKPASAPADKRNYDYWLAQGDRLRAREKFEAALDAYGEASDLKPDRAEPYAGRGLALLDLGQRPQAEASFQEALKLNPRYAVAVMGLAETYRQMGKKEEAIQFYEQYLEILPNGPEAPVAQSAIERLKE